MCTSASAASASLRYLLLGLVGGGVTEHLSLGLALCLELSKMDGA